MATRNAAKVLNQIKELLNLQDQPDAAVIPHITKFVKWKNELVDFINLTMDDKVKVIEDPHGVLKEIIENSFNDPLLAEGVNFIREAMRHYNPTGKPQVTSNDVVVNAVVSMKSFGYDQISIDKQIAYLRGHGSPIQRLLNHPAAQPDLKVLLSAMVECSEHLIEQNRGMSGLLNTTCEALGVSRKEPQKLMPALSNLTMAVSILKGFSATRPVSNEEPRVMMKLTQEGAPGVYTVTQNWIEWFAGTIEGGVGEGTFKSLATKAIEKRVHEEIENNLEGWPRGLSLIISFPEWKDSQILPPNVIFAANVGEQVDKAFGENT